MAAGCATEDREEDPVLSAIDAIQRDLHDHGVSVDIDVDLKPVERLNAFRGALLFFTDVRKLHGNGRSCATCHRPEDQFGLTPATVEARYQALQLARKIDPKADDPLFRPIDADDLANDYTILRTKALVRVRLKLPPNARLTDDPNATTVDVFRSVPTIRNTAFSNPYQLDRREETLEAQALSAFTSHMEVQSLPDEASLRFIGDFERSQFSSFRIRRMARELLAGNPDPPDPDPELTPLQAEGKALFAHHCGHCHSTRTQTKLNDARFFPPFDGSNIPVVGNLEISAPKPPNFPSELPNDNGLPIRRYTITMPDGTQQIRASDDPGRFLTTGNPTDFDRFDVMPLYGISKTAPYFHNNRAATLRDVLLHYQNFFGFLHNTVKFPVPELEDKSFEPLLAYLEVL